MSVFRQGAWRAIVVAAVLLAGCATPPTPAPSASRIGIETPGAVPVRLTGLRPLAHELSVPSGAPPRSTVAAVNYDLLAFSIDDAYPEADDDEVPGDDEPRKIFQRGGASWYGIQFHQRRTANGERFDMSAFTAAHRTLPFGTAVCVRSLANGREVLVRINDRGPFSAGRIIDLSRAAAVAIDMVHLGIKQVALTLVNDRRMRCAGVPVDPPVSTPSGIGFEWNDSHRPGQGVSAPRGAGKTGFARASVRVGRSTPAAQPPMSSENVALRSCARRSTSCGNAASSLPLSV